MIQKFTAKNKKGMIGVFLMTILFANMFFFVPNQRAQAFSFTGSASVVLGCAGSKLSLGNLISSANIQKAFNAVKSIFSKNVGTSDTKDQQATKDVKTQLKDDSKAQKVAECMKGIAYAAAKQVLAKLTARTVNWINSGYQGNPLYVQDEGSFLKSIWDEQNQQWMDELKNFKTYPYGRDFLKSYLTNVTQSASDTLKRAEVNYLSGSGCRISEFSVTPSSVVTSTGSTSSSADITFTWKTTGCSTASITGGTLKNKNLIINNNIVGSLTVPSNISTDTAFYMTAVDNSTGLSTSRHVKVALDKIEATQTSSGCAILNFDVSPSGILNGSASDISWKVSTDCTKTEIVDAGGNKQTGLNHSGVQNTGNLTADAAYYINSTRGDGKTATRHLFIAVDNDSPTPPGGNTTRKNQSSLTGGWDSFLAQTQSPAGTPIGFQMQAQSVINSATQNAIDLAQKGLDRSHGFLDQKKCVAWVGKDRNAVFDAPDAAHPEKDCVRWETQTPGAIAEDQLANVLGTSVRQLELANDVNQILNAVFDRMLTTLTTKGIDAISAEFGGSKTSSDLSGPGANTARIEDFGDFGSFGVTNSFSSSGNTGNLLPTSEASGGSWFSDNQEFDIKKNLPEIIQAQRDYIQAIEATKNTNPTERILPSLGVMLSGGQVSLGVDSLNNKAGFCANGYSCNSDGRCASCDANGTCTTSGFCATVVTTTCSNGASCNNSGKCSDGSFCKNPSLSISPQCADGIDNDGNGKIDVEDSDSNCSSDPLTAVEKGLGGNWAPTNVLISGIVVGNNTGQCANGSSCSFPDNATCSDGSTCVFTATIKNAVIDNAILATSDYGITFNPEVVTCIDSSGANLPSCVNPSINDDTVNNKVTPCRSTDGGPGLTRSNCLNTTNLSKIYQCRDSAGNLINCFNPKIFQCQNVNKKTRPCFSTTKYTRIYNAEIKNAKITRINNNQMIPFGSLEAIDKIVPAIAELDYCIPGPNQGSISKAIDSLPDIFSTIQDTPMVWNVSTNGDIQSAAESQFEKTLQGVSKFMQDTINNYQSALKNLYGKTLIENNLPVAKTASRYTAALFGYDANITTAKDDYNTVVSTVSFNLKQLENIQMQILPIVQRGRQRALAYANANQCPLGVVPIISGTTISDEAINGNPKTPITGAGQFPSGQTWFTPSSGGINSGLESSGSTSIQGSTPTSWFNTYQDVIPSYNVNTQQQPLLQYFGGTSSGSYYIDNGSGGSVTSGTGTIGGGTTPFGGN